MDLYLDAHEPLSLQKTEFPSCWNKKQATYSVKANLWLLLSTGKLCCQEVKHLGASTRQGVSQTSKEWSTYSAGFYGATKKITALLTEEENI